MIIKYRDKEQIRQIKEEIAAIGGSESLILHEINSRVKTIEIDIGDCVGGDNFNYVLQQLKKNKIKRDNFMEHMLDVAIDLNLQLYIKDTEIEYLKDGCPGDNESPHVVNSEFFDTFKDKDLNI